MGYGADSKEYTRNVVTADRPKITYAETAVHSYNSVVYMMGKHDWQTVSIVIRDTVDNSIVKAVGDQLQRQLDHHNQVSPLSGHDYKFTTKMTVMTGGFTGDGGTGPLDPEIDAWWMEGCFLQNIDYDGGDYSASEPLQVTLTVRFDNALHLAGVDDITKAGLTRQTAGDVHSFATLVGGSSA